jgi:hypothetical protein
MAGQVVKVLTRVILKVLHFINDLSKGLYIVKALNETMKFK